MGIFKKHYWLVLLFVVLVSYGQVIRMLPWQDDNALFFKLANIAGRAGYLGSGPFGEGAYKYTATPYIPVFKLFGFNTVAYFVFAFICYFLVTIIVYKVFSRIFNEFFGRIAGFLFGAGYVASDGFIRLYNTVLTSLSIVFVSGLFFCYWNFYKKKNYYWYFGSVFFYFLATEFAKARTQYLISIVVAFEIIFLVFRRPILKYILFSFLRLMPFVYIFYEYFVLNADSRSEQISLFIKGILHGQLYLFYGLLSAVRNIAIPDWINIPNRTVIFILSTIAFYLIFKKQNKGLLKFTLCFLISVLWSFAARSIFRTPVLNLGISQTISVYLGGEIVLFLFAIFFAVKDEIRKEYLFFLTWVIFGILAYAVYDPTITYVTVQRYLVHSFFAFTVLLSILFLNLIKQKNMTAKFGIVLIIIWGTGNLISAFSYQNQIVQTRSIPVKNFYKQLESYLPKIKKGDVLYFDVADDARGNFADAFSVAQMPEETAIAWRYGIDRYDMRMVTSYDGLRDIIKAGGFGDINENQIKLGNIYSFFYSHNRLVDTSFDIRKVPNIGNVVPVNFKQNMNEIDFDPPIISVLPNVLKINLSVKLNQASTITFPYISDRLMEKNSVAADNNLRNLAFQYQNFLLHLRSTIKVTTVSDWRENTHENITDGDIDTAWQPDRILWHDGKQNFTLDLESIYKIDRFVWKNAYGNNTPTEYKVDISLDGVNWAEVKQINNVHRIDPVDLQVVSFPLHDARFVRMRLLKSLNDDSPGISEAWVVPGDFDLLNIGSTESFLAEPFGYVPDEKSFNDSLAFLKSKGKVQIYWLTDKSDSWQTTFSSFVNVAYDQGIKEYQIQVPAGGIHLKAIKFGNMEIPGEVYVKNIITNE